MQHHLLLRWILPVDLEKKLCVKRYSENYALNKSSIFSLIMQSGWQVLKIVTVLHENTVLLQQQKHRGVSNGKNPIGHEREKLKIFGK